MRRGDKIKELAYRLYLTDFYNAKGLVTYKGMRKASNLLKEIETEWLKLMSAEDFLDESVAVPDNSSDSWLNIISESLVKFTNEPLYFYVVPNRKREVKNIRFMVMWFMRKRLAWSYLTIAKIFEKDHTSVINAVRKHTYQYCKDPIYKSDADNLYTLFLITRKEKVEETQLETA